MRIAVYSTLRLHPWGAPDTLWVRAAQAALGDGHAVFATVRPQIAQRAEIAELRRRGAEIHLVPDLAHGGRATQAAAHVRNLRSGAWRTVAAFRRFQPQVVIVNQGGFYDFLAEQELRDWLAARRVPYLVLAHSNYEGPAMDEATRRIAGDFIRGARSFLAISRYVIELAERQLLVSLPAARVFHNPVDIAAALPLPWPDDAVPNLAVVSRLDAHGKGLDVLLPALRDGLGREGEWRLNVYGEGPDRGYLQALAGWCGLGDRVMFHGHVADKALIWSRNHLLLLPSRWEGCSYAMVEALLCGRPVLRTDYGGVAEWMPGGRHGFICAAPEAKLLVATLRSAWDRRAEWREMGRAGHDHARMLLDPQPHRTLLNLVYA